MWGGLWNLSADEDPDVRLDLRGDAEPRPNEGEELDVRLDLRGDAAENPGEPVAAAEPREDVEGRPVAVEGPSAGHDLCGDVTVAPAACDDLVTAVECREEVAETLDLCLAINDTKLVEHVALTHSATADFVWLHVHFLTQNKPKNTLYLDYFF